MKKTKLFALLLGVVMAAGCFSGCTTTQTTDSSTFVIGGIGPTTGEAADYGKAVKNGAELAIKEINDKGGVNGIKLKLEFQDDEHDAEKSVNAYNTLKDKNMKVLVGCVTSKPCEAVAASAKRDNMFLLTPSATSVNSIDGDNAFRLCFSDPNQGAASAKCIVDYKLGTKVAIIYNNSDTYSSGINETFKNKAKEVGIEVVAEEAYTSDNNKDFKAQLQKVKESGAELLFLPMYYEDASLIIKQANSEGLNVKFFGSDGLDGIIKQLESDSALAEGVMLLTPFAADSKDEKSQAFTTAYKAAYNDATPTQFAADAYDCVYAVKQALEKADVKDAKIDVKELSNLLQKAMHEITFEGVTGTITWDVNGEPSKDAKAMVIKDGAYAAMDLQ